MNTTLLINAIVRQTMVLVASLATASGQRAQLASVANLAFADLVRELREQGLGNKVIADMFGLALRTYHRKVARLSASRTVQGHSLWEAVLAHIQQHGPLLRSELMLRFARDDEATLHSVVADLIESALVQRDGDGDATRLQSTQPSSERDAVEQGPAALDALVLVALHRGGPLAAGELTTIVPTELHEIEAALARLVATGVVSKQVDSSPAVYACETCVIMFGESAGWEAAVFDHYQAMVTALVTKLRKGTRRADLADAIGGSTFVYDLWPGHPLQAEVLGYLRSMRERGIALRKAVEAYNALGSAPAEARQLRVIAYVGQTVAEEGETDA
jgi:hypothetical protein